MATRNAPTFSDSANMPSVPPSNRVRAVHHGLRALFQKSPARVCMAFSDASAVARNSLRQGVLDHRTGPSFGAAPAVCEPLSRQTATAPSA